MSCLLAVSAVYTSPSLKERFKQIQEIRQLSFDKENYQSISSRFAKIEAALKVIKKNTLFGTGTGDLSPALQQEYQEMNFVMGIKHNYNPHNQYLENLARNGLIGGAISMLFLFLVPLYYAFKRQSNNLKAVIIIASVVCLTESIFAVHKGITFYAFFSTLFFSMCNRPLNNYEVSI